MIGKTISRYRIVEKLGEGGRIQCAAVSSYANRDGSYAGQPKLEIGSQH